MATKLIFLSFGAMLVFGGYLHFLSAKRIWNTYRRICGVVTQHKAAGGSGFAPVISFEMDGKKCSFTSNVRSDWTARLKLGSECYVLVNPIDTHKVLDGRSSYFWMRATAPCFMGMLAIAGGFFWK